MYTLDFRVLTLYRAAMNFTQSCAQQKPIYQGRPLKIRAIYSLYNLA